jgi:phosphate transport system substrate-binding protein
MKNADALIREVKYVPLPKAAYEGNLKHAKDGKIGTVFGGKNEVGITVEEIMKREAKM